MQNLYFLCTIKFRLLMAVLFTISALSVLPTTANSSELKLSVETADFRKKVKGEFVLEGFKTNKKGITNTSLFKISSKKITFENKKRRMVVSIKIPENTINTKQLREKPTAANIFFEFDDNDNTITSLATIWLEFCGAKLCEKTFYVFVPIQGTGIKDVSSYRSGSCTPKKLSDFSKLSVSDKNYKKLAARMYSVCKAGKLNGKLDLISSPLAEAGWFQSTTKLVSTIGNRSAEDKNSQESNYRLDRIVKKYLPFGKNNEDNFFEKRTGLKLNDLDKDWKDAIAIDDNMLLRAGKKPKPPEPTTRTNFNRGTGS